MKLLNCAFAFACICGVPYFPLWVLGVVLIALAWGLGLYYYLSKRDGDDDSREMSGRKSNHYPKK